VTERDGYQHGVPCWVETWQNDPDRATAFYSSVFGWEIENTMPPDADGTFHICRLRGRDVAGIGSPIPEGAPSTPVWTTFIQVDSVDEAAGKVKEGGGSVVVEPFDSLEGGRLAIVTDPAGAAFAPWEPGEHTGAQVINQPGAWAMSGLETTDPEGAKAFYRDVFGWESEAFGPPEAGFTLFRLPGYVGGTPQQPVPRDNVATIIAGGEGPARWSVDFWVFDADEAAAKAGELGGRVVSPPNDVPGVAGMREAVLADPQGAAFNITQPPGV
jgi:uncharacterized protein